ncbi:unnamed protein product [Amoebophrya sp. A120]|nr:unnamed protein product [Amoebophrya sp. A120]|eukprot:GSA120T00002387001.1
MSYPFGQFASNSYHKAFTDCASRALKAWRPALSVERQQWWNAMWPHWPPKDATPLMAIEPFGKNLFVHNARSADVNALPDPRAPCQLDHRPDWVQDQFVKDCGPETMRQETRLWPSATKTGDTFPCSSHGKPRVGNFYRQRLDPRAQERPEARQQPMLCLTDYRRRVLGYLSREEWEDFRRALPVLKQQLHEYTETTPPPSEDMDKIEAQQRQYLPYRRYKIGTNKSCNHTGYHGHRRPKIHPHAGFQRMLRRRGYIKKAHVLGMTRHFEGRLIPTHPNTMCATYGYFRQHALNRKMAPHGFMQRPSRVSK